MIQFVLAFFLVISSSLSLAESELEIDEIQEIIADSQFSSHTPDFSQELKKIGHDKLDLQALKDPRILEIVEKQFDASNISLQSMEEKRKHFNEGLQGSFLSELLSFTPKLRDIMADILTDKKSMIGLMSIFQKEKERSYLLYMFIGVIVLNIILRKTLISASTHFFIKFLQRIFINFFTFALSSWAFYSLFTKELSPLIKIIKSHF